MAIPAIHESRCSWCDRMILEGEPIEEVDGEWLHEECSEEAED